MMEEIREANYIFFKSGGLSILQALAKENILKAMKKEERKEALEKVDAVNTVVYMLKRKYSDEALAAESKLQELKSKN